MTEKVVNILDRFTVILVNKERVIFEMVELARLRISMVLGVSQSKVDARCNLDSHGKMQVQFSVDEDSLKTLPPEKVQETIKTEYQKALVRIQERLANLGDVRGIEEK
jgi:hypothetical protein